MRTTYFVLVMTVILAGCKYLQPACNVIRVVDQVCTVVEYVGDDGQIHREPVTSDELVGLAKAAAARRTYDAGAPSSSVR